MSGDPSLIVNCKPLLLETTDNLLKRLVSGLSSLQNNLCYAIEESSSSGENKKLLYNVVTCDQDKDACQGDSGGPLIWQNSKRDRYELVLTKDDNVISTQL